MKKLVDFLFGIADIVIFVYAIVAGLPLLLGYHPVVVESDLMEPTFSMGDIAYYEEVDSMEDLVNDKMVAYLTPDGEVRIARAYKKSGSLVYTAYDSDKENTADEVAFSQVKGQVQDFKVHFVGFIVAAVNNYTIVPVAIALIILAKIILMFTAKENKKRK